jgi:hypothetical protein
MRSAISDASTAVDVCELLPKTSTQREGLKKDGREKSNIKGNYEPKPVREYSEGNVLMVKQGFQNC